MYTVYTCTQATLCAWIVNWKKQQNVNSCNGCTLMTAPRTVLILLLLLLLLLNECHHGFSRNEGDHELTGRKHQGFGCNWLDMRWSSRIGRDHIVTKLPDKQLKHMDGLRSKVIIVTIRKQNKQIKKRSRFLTLKTKWSDNVSKRFYPVTNSKTIHILFHYFSTILMDKMEPT